MQWAASDFEAPLERVLDHCVVFFESIAVQQAQALSKPSSKALSVKRSERPAKRRTRPR
jgi:hypothetical protein